jgi:hypothetical protein
MCHELVCAYRDTSKGALLEQVEGLVGQHDAVNGRPGRSGLDGLLQVEQGGRAGRTETLKASGCELENGGNHNRDQNQTPLEG